MKRGILYMICVLVLFMFSGCGAERSRTEKLKDLSFHVLTEEEIPEELKEKIEEKDMEPFRMTYTDDGSLYITEGYGKRDTSGYSVEVEECYETANAVYIHTNLAGPAKDEKVVRKETNPYVVVKLAETDKNVVFE